LAQARTAAYDVSGNELSDAAIRLAHERFNLELSPLPLEHDPRAGTYDVITMWGVLEHLLDPLSALKGAFRLLRSGGLLYVYTPTWCLYGRYRAYLSSDCTCVAAPRPTGHVAHLQLFSAQTMRKTMRLIGFEIVRMEEVCEYNLPVAAYLESLGVSSGRQLGFASAILNQMIDRRLFFRNNMRVFCLKPASA